MTNPAIRRASNPASFEKSPGADRRDHARGECST